MLLSAREPQSLNLTPIPLTNTTTALRSLARIERKPGLTLRHLRVKRFDPEIDDHSARCTTRNSTRPKPSATQGPDVFGAGPGKSLQRQWVRLDRSGPLRTPRKTRTTQTASTTRLRPSSLAL